jgi:hypothetical protein
MANPDVIRHLINVDLPHVFSHAIFSHLANRAGEVDRLSGTNVMLLEIARETRSSNRPGARQEAGRGFTIKSISKTAPAHCSTQRICPAALQARNPLPEFHETQVWPPCEASPAVALLDILPQLVQLLFEAPLVYETPQSIFIPVKTLVVVDAKTSAVAFFK